MKAERKTKPTRTHYFAFKQLGGGDGFLGFTVAAFSIGRFISTFALGYLMIKFSSRTLFLATTGMIAVGCLLYGLAGIKSFFLSSKWVREREIKNEFAEQEKIPKTKPRQK